MELSAGDVRVYEPIVAEVTPDTPGTPGPDDTGDIDSGRLPSFDQARHAGDGTRPGSWMAVAFAAPATGPPVDEDRIAAAWHRVIERHGTLRTVLRQHPPDHIRVHDIEITGGDWRSAGGSSDPRKVLRLVFDECCEPFGTPSHRLAVVTHEDGTHTIVIGLDHSHTDAWSLLVLVRDMLAFLGQRDEEDPSVAATPDALPPAVPSFAEHTRELEQRPMAPLTVSDRWDDIMADGHGDMPVFPLDLGDVSSPRDEVVEVVDVLDSDGLARLEAAVASRGVRLLPAAVSVLTAVNRELGAGDLRAVFPVHSRTGPVDDKRRWSDSVGWFITNSVLECSSADLGECTGAVAEAIALGAHPLEPLLRPWGGMPHTPGMFALSWLDNRRLPVSVPAEAHPQHVSAWIRTDGVMAWFVLNDDGMHLRVRYPGTPEASMNVSEWARRVTEGLRNVADRGFGSHGAGSDDAVLVGEDDNLSPVSQR